MTDNHHKTDKKIKGLFITHDSGNYGASRSLQLLLNNYKNIEADLVVMKVLFRKNNLDAIKKRFGENVHSVTGCYLPYDFCFKYKRKSKILLFLMKMYATFTWLLGKRKLYSVIRKGNYDFIHLNSLVLHEIITSEYPFIIHIRDIFDHSSKKASESLQKARGVIFIDETTREPFKDAPLTNSIVLNNPVDMTPLKDTPKGDLGQSNADFRNNTVFSMIGVISEEKGTGFVVECFKRLKNDNVRLLIVGGRERSSLQKCKRLAKNDRRIIFWGEEPDILKIYAVSDYILRGEPYQCVGRTIYEGLYAGCKVIIPGKKDDVSRIFEHNTFKDSIYWYTPRDGAELEHMFEKLSHQKITARKYRSNVESYVLSFHEFVLRATGNNV